MDFKFSLFEPKKARNNKNTEPTVSITPTGRLSFNKMATELLAGKKYCKLGFDENNQAVGILPVDESDPNSFNVRYTAKGAYVGAKRFFKFIKSQPTEILKLMPVKSGNFIGLKM